ncbi:D-alanyl-D-alanine carboxypeptidase [Corynebacterium pyruviciproducens]|uniref:D-alanyl-D-alanine carboxypeptidase family protein n=1 Tax=Corynebacterium pyruviciproducens TaxID=598660 RepID=UPI0024557E84|nr:serine hydrolase [Corynebacterium pyruviciproducens]MDH4657487.1 D-alanyl-D-alanine carboxypeptidase [Corynebacterium pyruviciproducens]
MRRLIAVGVGLTLAGAPTLALAATPTTTAAPTTPNTDSCPFAVTPPPAVDHSEEPGPGMEAPTPLPASDSTFAGCGVTVPPGFELADGLVAHAFLVFDLDTGDIYAAKDPHGRYRPASIIKVLLAGVAIDSLDPRDTVEVTPDSANQEGSSAGIGPGGHYTVDDLLHGLLMASGNDTAHALAQKLGGDEKTLKLVNERAHDLGATDTRVATYSGLDAPGMQTSAFDMALFFSDAWKKPAFRSILATEKYDFPGFDDNPGFEMWNDNRMLFTNENALGGKTGFTDDARHTYVGAMNHKGHRLAAVILDTEVTQKRAWQQAESLIEATDPETMEPVGTLRTQPTSTPTPTPSAPAETQSPAEHQGDGSRTSPARLAAWGIVIPIGVLLLAVIAASITSLVGKR